MPDDGSKDTFRMEIPAGKTIAINATRHRQGSPGDHGPLHNDIIDTLNKSVGWSVGNVPVGEWGKKFNRTAVRFQPTQDQLMDIPLVIAQVDHYDHYDPERSFGFTLKDGEQTPNCFPGDFPNVQLPDWCKKGFALFVRGFYEENDNHRKHICDLKKIVPDSLGPGIWHLGFRNLSGFMNDSELDLHVYFKVVDL